MWKCSILPDGFYSPLKIYGKWQKFSMIGLMGLNGSKVSLLSYLNTFCNSIQLMKMQQNYSFDLSILLQNTIVCHPIFFSLNHSFVNFTTQFSVEIFEKIAEKCILWFVGEERSTCSNIISMNSFAFLYEKYHKIWPALQQSRRKYSPGILLMNKNTIEFIVNLPKIVCWRT